MKIRVTAVNKDLRLRHLDTYKVRTILHRLVPIVNWEFYCHSVRLGELFFCSSCGREVLHIGICSVDTKWQPPYKVLRFCHASRLFNIHGLVMREGFETPHSSLLRYLLVVNI